MDSSEIFSSKTLIGELGMFSDSSADTRCSDDNNIDKTNVDIIHIADDERQLSVQLLQTCH